MKTTDVPFPHVIVDDFCLPDVADKLLADFPDPTDKWYKYENCFETKFATDKPDLIPSSLFNFLISMNQPRFLTILENIFHIDGLIPDPHLRGGGLHYIKKGGKLDIHADFNLHPKLKLERRLNVILYLNKAWAPGDGGELELWNKDLTEKKIVEPIFNRCVAFRTDSESFHGHPNVWNSNSPRRSVALYYYTVPHHGLKPHSTLYQRLPGQESIPEVELLREQRAKGRIA